MIIVFLAKFGPVATVLLQERKTVNAEWCINFGQPKVYEVRSARRPNDGTRRLLVHYDDANAHIAVATLDYLEANRVELVIQAPYSPGSAPCDFFLFLK